MPTSHRIASRDGLPFDFSDGIKVAGVTLGGSTGGQAIKVLVKDTDVSPTDLYTWVRETAASLTTLLTTGVQVTTAANQASGTNSTLIANTAFVTAAVTAAINSLVGSAPVALNTLQELATAINNDPTFNTTITSAIALKSNILDIQKASYTTASASLVSTVDALSALFSPTITSLTQGQQFLIRTKGTNTQTVPTFTPNQGVIAAKSIIKGPGVTLAAGDIGIWACLQYDIVSDTFVLLNPNSPANSPAATTAVAGNVKLATTAIALAGTDSTTAVTPSAMTAAIAAAVNSVSGNLRAPVLSTTPIYNEKGGSITVNMSATPVSPDTSITRFEITIDGQPVVSVAAAANAATYTVSASISNNLTLGSSYQVAVTAIGNTGTKSPYSVYPISVGGIIKPTLLFPTANAINVSLTPTFTSSTFNFLLGTDTHATSLWEVMAQDGTLVWSSLSAINKTSVTMPVNILQSGTNYKVHIKHYGNVYTVGSDFSDMISFSTTVTTAISTQGVITSSAPDTANGFGYDVSISDNGYSVVSAPYAYGLAGSIDIHYHSTPLAAWGPATSTFGGSSQLYMGFSVIISPDGTRLAVAQPGYNSGAGAVNIYSLSNNGTAVTAAVVATVTGAANTNGLNGLGSALTCDTSMSRFAVGVRNKDVLGLPNGVVSIYTLSGSTATKEVDLHCADNFGGYFGSKISMDGTGTWLAVTSTAPVPKLYIYQRTGTTWSLVSEFTPDATSGTILPVVFNAAGTRLALGSYTGNALSGFIYVFDYDGTNWVNTSTLIDHSTTAAYAGIAQSLDMSALGNVIVAGAPVATISGFGNCGKAVIYRYLSGNWVQNSTDIYPPSQGASVNFGHAVALSADGTKVLITSPGAYMVSGQQAQADYYSI